MLENIVEADGTEKLCDILGIALLDGPAQADAIFKYTLTDVAKIVFGANAYWSPAMAMIFRIESEKGFNIKSSNNKYHIEQHYGKSTNHKYSMKFIDLLLKIKNGEDYDLDLS